jgi:hypothetical protein
MRKFFTLVLFLSLFSSLTKAQDVRVENAIVNQVSNVDFGNDILVANTNPIGPMSGVKAPSGTIFAAINDTVLTSNLGLIVMQSSNSGNSWTMLGSGITARVKYDQIKMVKTTDSVYCFFKVGTAIYRWNPVIGTLIPLNIAPSKSFDVAISSTNSLYIFYHTSGDTLRRASSIDGGITWGSVGLISNSGGSPVATFSTIGDTVLLNYRGPYRADAPEKSIWRSALYRQSAPGTLAFISLSFVDIITDTSVVHSELKTVRRGPMVWTVYSEGTTGNLNLKAMTSLNSGTVYGTPFNISASPTRDEYWFDFGASVGTSFNGVDLIYYTDSLQSGNPTNASDKMMYSYSGFDTPSIFSNPMQFSEVPPVWSASGCKPSLVEFSGNDFGVLFLGYTPTGNKVYWDRFTAVTGVTPTGNTVADKFELKQNYPNPFNPTTNISFNIPKNSFVTLKVFDIMGREVAKLVSGNMERGNYSVQFDAKKLSSGVYFYKLEADNFTEVKKMSLIK